MTGKAGSFLSRLRGTAFACSVQPLGPEWFKENSRSTLDVSDGVVFNDSVALVINEWGVSRRHFSYALVERGKNGWKKEATMQANTEDNKHALNDMIGEVFNVLVKKAMQSRTSVP